MLDEARQFTDECSEVLLKLHGIFSAASTSAFPEVAPVDFTPRICEVNGKNADYQYNSAIPVCHKYKNKLSDCKSAKDIATKVVEQLDSSLFKKIDVTDNGFITFSLSDSFVLDIVRSNYCDYNIKLEVKKPVSLCIDYSSPNIAKEMHVGHLRSTINGESISRVMEFVGHNVDRINHIGDWGTQFGMLIEYLLTVEPEFMQKDTSIAELNEFYRSSKKKFDLDEEFKTKARNRVVLLQSGDPKSVEAWKMFLDISMKEFNKIYEMLNIKLETVAESFYNDRLPKIVEMCEQKGIVTEVDGAKCIFVRDEGKIKLSETPLIIVKSDGGYGYDTTDLAALHYRFVEKKYDWVMYITDKGQHNHFLAAFQAAQMMEWYSPHAQYAQHISLGLVCGSDGKKFKTRSGDTVRLADLLNESIERAKQQFKTRRPDLDDEQVNKLSTSMGLSAVRYFDMNQIGSNDYKFDYDKMLDHKGNTAVYLLYTFARIKSIQRNSKFSTSVESIFDKIQITNEYERNLLLHIDKFPDYVKGVLTSLSVHHICDFAYQLCVIFSEFYNNCRINNTDEEESRIVIVHLTERLLLTALNLLGIEPLETI